MTVVSRFAFHGGGAKSGGSVSPICSLRYQRLVCFLGGNWPLLTALRTRTQHERPRLERCAWGITFQARPNFSYGLENRE